MGTIHPLREINKKQDNYCSTSLVQGCGGWSLSTQLGAQGRHQPGQDVLPSQGVLTHTFILTQMRTM